MLTRDKQHGALTAAAETVAELEAALVAEYQPATPHAQFLVHYYRAATKTRVDVDAVLSRARLGLPFKPNPNLAGEAYPSKRRQSGQAIAPGSAPPFALPASPASAAGYARSGNEPETVESMHATVDGA